MMGKTRLMGGQIISIIIIKREKKRACRREMTAEERGGKRVMNSKMNGTVDLCKTSLLQLSSRFEECKIFEPGWDVLHHQATFLRAFLSNRVLYMYFQK